MNFDLNSLDSVAMNIVVAFLIQKMKLSSRPIFKWITTATPKINLLVSVILAAATAAGMSVNWTDSGATHTLAVSGISWTSFFMFVWYTIKNFAFQYTAYKTAFKQSKEDAVPPPPPVEGIGAPLP